MSGFSHVPVLLRETVAALVTQPGGVYVDGTLGGGGHTAALLEAGARHVLGIDRDPAALAAARERFDADHVTVVRGNFRDIGTLAPANGFDRVDGVLLDIGVSSHQLDTAERGFSFNAEAELDMRMDPTTGPTAADLVNTLPEVDLADVIYRYGEERASRRIARQIVERRRTAPIATTTELASVVQRAVGGGGGRIHPATRTFQALRIAVNDELGALETALPAATALLGEAGRLAVITFHSLEDRIVKQFIQREASICMLPPRVFAEGCPHLLAGGTGARPCIYLGGRDCDYAPQLSMVTHKPIVASDKETTTNVRSRSAKLRVAARI